MAFVENFRNVAGHRSHRFGGDDKIGPFSQFIADVIGEAFGEIIPARISGKVFQVDLGSFFPMTDLNCFEEFEKEVRNFSKHFRKWSIKKYPEMLCVFEKELDGFIAKIKEEGF